MSKPEKYFVFTERDITALYNRMIEEKINCSQKYGSVVVKCEMSSRSYPGQLRFIDSYGKENYNYWPSEDIEHDDYSEIDKLLEIKFDALKELELI